MISGFIGRISAVHDNHKRIASGALLIGVLTLGAKLFVAVREMAIAWRYGVSSTVDAYQLALTITIWLPMLVNSVMTVVLVPRLVVLTREGRDRHRFIEELNGTFVLIGVAASLLIWLCAPFLASLLASGENPATLAATAGTASRIAPVAFCIIVCGYLSARLQSRERFIYSASEAVPALVIALVLVLPLHLGGILPLIVGTLVGYVLQIVVLGRMVQHGDPPIGSLSIRHTSPEWNSLYGAVMLMVIGQLLITLATPVDQAFASRLGPGAVATLGYATRVVTLLTGLGAVVVARALLPVLSGAVASGDLALGRRQALQWSALMGGAAAVGTAILWFAAPLMVRLIFQRGAFDASATAAVAHVLRFGLLQLPFYFGGMVLVQWIVANGNFRILLYVGFIALAVKVAMNFLLVRLLGLGGIALATSAMYVCSCAIEYFYVRNEQ